MELYTSKHIGAQVNKTNRTIKAARVNLIYLSSHWFSVIHSTTKFDEILLLPSETTLDSDDYLLTIFYQPTAMSLSWKALSVSPPTGGILCCFYEAILSLLSYLYTFPSCLNLQPKSHSFIPCLITFKTLFCILCTSLSPWLSFILP